MGRFTKNIVALVIILLLASPLVVSIFNLLQQKNLHSNIAARFKTEIIQTISIAKADLYWAKKNKEVIIDGKYFDVKSFIVTGDSISLTGFYDHHEDKLAKRMTKQMKQNSATDAPVNTKFVKCFFFPVFTPQSAEGLSLHWKAAHINYPAYSVKISDISLSIISPPPRL